ncbi:hypothetical protein SADUNF_Sadunf08G0026500 [Salix dunnii]|uniref:Uncharacterized protein n=1 Tax=Salix dunnii TaxID=1413687 RepID=A0A835JUC1_9ROSI|nr:hypothetical protein SADUNF_Sadunf08G0026500 [Salix dunnii]
MLLSAAAEQVAEMGFKGEGRLLVILSTLEANGDSGSHFSEAIEHDTKQTTRHINLYLMSKQRVQFHSTIKHGESSRHIPEE